MYVCACVYVCTLCYRQESLKTDLAQVQEEYATNKDNSKKTIQVYYQTQLCYHVNTNFVILLLLKKNLMIVVYVYHSISITELTHPQS